MKIGEFAEKYGVDKRSIDYWTNLELLHPTESEANTNNYREYGPEAEEEMKLILIATAMNVKPLADYVKVLRILPKSEWNKFVIDRIQCEIDNSTAALRKAMDFATEFM